ncbi:tetratricopeptide repeat protein [Leptolinea tardivitalis]|uniref:Uncharacterized protein n=1 Tax=Leptolinea tardivitalis TaxID=229920 RepID=A0A0P6XNJ5_9CHLR|nr:tetratricopeptide repeat protein [Leptolinea tardivitalis]KPL70558.1 hypothetical protein ADM99_15705 [Leptolinea tardivitalis]GAP22166.1 hypothetical protein LTAR_02389 [Leptolinea tardivitalis]
MPVLPSGKSIELIPQMRQINFINSLPAPGCFWIDSSRDLQDYSTLPGEVENSRPMKQVPLPESLEDFKKYISIVVVDEFGYPEITDFNLKSFPPDGYLNSQDLVTWNNWITSEPVQLYLELRMQDCFDQVDYLTRLSRWEAEKNLKELEQSSFIKRYDLFLQNEPPDEKKKRHELKIQHAQQAINRLTAMTVKDPNAQVTWVDLLLEQFDVTKKWSDGEEILFQRYAKDPEQTAYHVGYLKCLFNQQKYADTETQAWEAVKQYPQNIEYWLILIKVFYYRQQYDEALQIVTSALAINPGNQELLDFQFKIETAINK